MDLAFVPQRGLRQVILGQAKRDPRIFLWRSGRIEDGKKDPRVASLRALPEDDPWRELLVTSPQSFRTTLRALLAQEDWTPAFAGDADLKVRFQRSSAQ
jgi:hypothetical protein